MISKLECRVRIEEMAVERRKKVVSWITVFVGAVPEGSFDASRSR